MITTDISSYNDEKGKDNINKDVTNPSFEDEITESNNKIKVNNLIKNHNEYVKFQNVDKPVFEEKNQKSEKQERKTNSLLTNDYIVWIETELIRLLKDKNSDSEEWIDSIRKIIDLLVNFFQEKCPNDIDSFIEKLRSLKDRFIEDENSLSKKGVK